MLLLIGLSILFKLCAAEASCNTNQLSLVHIMATEDDKNLPNASAMLPVNATCQWNITAPFGKVLRIDIRAVIFHGPCDDEHFKIFDGPNNSSDVIATYCNVDTFTRTYFFSSSRSLFLETKTGHSSSPSFLQLYYQSVDFQDCSTNTTLDAPESPTEHNFSSPYYPFRTPRNKSCGWYITAPEDHTVRVEIKSSFSKESVKVFDVDGSDITAISFGWNFFEDTATVFSKFRKMYIVFESNNGPQANSAAEGIFVSYTAIKTANSCSSSNTLHQNMNIMLKGSSGVIKTPGYPSTYPSDLVSKCIWKMVAPTGQVIRLDISSFRMGSTYCCLSVEDGIERENPVGIVKCGTQPSFAVYSTGRGLSLRVITSGCARGPGFIANYSFVPEGFSSGSCVLKDNSTMHISGEGGSFVTPGFPHPGLGMCGWNITVSLEKFIKLTFWKFRGSCDGNFAEVFDMTNSMGDSLTGKFCSPRVVFSKGNGVLAKYSAKMGVQQGGFFASYEALDTVPATYSCSDGRRVSELTGAAGEFASFDYPLNYPNDASCSWELKVPPTHLIELTFHSFDLQPSPDCTADYVEVKQGKNIIQSQVVGKFCGSSPPAPLQSNHSKMFINFATDSSGQYPGFRASFKALPNPAMGPCKLQGVDNSISLTGNTGRLFSPLHPQTYPPNMTCTWMITVPDGHFVKLKIMSFRLESSCRGVALDIRDGQGESSDLLKSFCGRNFESSLFSSGRHLWVRFHSPGDTSLTGSGFTAVFEAVNQLPAPFSCSESDSIVKLQSQSGTLASYNYPLPYDGSIKCLWLINVDTDYKIKLSFEFFNLSRSSDCSEDYVEVRDGQFSTSDLLGKFCGSEKPESITSDLWDLRVEFKSSGKTKFPGFKASYETKKSTAAILKIVGIVVGVLSVLCTLIGACCKYHTSRGPDDVEPAVQNSENSRPAEDAGIDNLCSKRKTTQL